MEVSLFIEPGWESRLEEEGGTAWLSKKIR